MIFLCFKNKCILISLTINFSDEYYQIFDLFIFLRATKKFIFISFAKNTSENLPVPIYFII